MHGGDELLFQQRHAEIEVAVQLAPASRGLAQAAGDVGEHVERPLRLVAVDPRAVVQRGHHEIPAALIGDHLLGHAVLRPIERRRRGGLADGGDARGHLALHVHHRLDQALRPAGEADAPAGHGVGLGNAGDGQRAVAQLRCHLGDRRMLEAVEQQMLVHVVGHDPDMRMLDHHVGDGAQLIAGDRGAGRVVRAVQHQPFGFFRNSGVDVLGPGLETVILRAGNKHRYAAHQFRHQRIGGPVWRRDNHLVARVHGGHQRVVDALLAAVGDADLVEAEIQVRIALELALDRFLQDLHAVLRRILRVPAQRRLVRGLDRMRRGIEIRLADRQRDHILAFGPQRAGLDGHLYGSRDRHPVQALGECRHLRFLQVRPWQKCWMRLIDSFSCSIDVA